MKPHPHKLLVLFPEVFCAEDLVCQNEVFFFWRQSVDCKTKAEVFSQDVMLLHILAMTRSRKGFLPEQQSDCYQM